MTDAKFTTREGGLDALVKALESESFVVSGRARLSLVDGELLVEVPFNVGSEYVGLSFTISLVSSAGRAPDHTVKEAKGSSPLLGTCEVAAPVVDIDPLWNT